MTAGRPAEADGTRRGHNPRRRTEAKAVPGAGEAQDPWDRLHRMGVVFLHAPKRNCSDGGRPGRGYRHPMKIREIMSTSIRCIHLADSVTAAAAVMRDHDVGALPVCDGGQNLVGVLTDRDIIVRVIANGLDPNRVKAGEAMTAAVISTFDDDDLEHSVAAMERHRIRRLPVLDRANRLVGMVSLADLAAGVDLGRTGATLREVSRQDAADLDPPRE